MSLRSLKSTYMAHIHVCSLIQKQQIRKLRRELDASQEKVATLTSQLAANVSLSQSKDSVKQPAHFHNNFLLERAACRWKAMGGIEVWFCF